MYVKIIDGKVAKYPYSVEDLRLDNPNTSFPKTPSKELLESFGVYPVDYVAAPECDPLTQHIELSDVPVLQDGKWALTKTVVQKTQQQIDSIRENRANDVRRKRNQLLTLSDWTQVADAPVNKEAWATYRQALRDITAQEGFPFDVVFPEQPSS